MDTERLTEIIPLRITSTTLHALEAIGNAQPVPASVPQVIRVALAQFIAAQHTPTPEATAFVEGFIR